VIYLSLQKFFSFNFSHKFTLFLIFVWFFSFFINIENVSANTCPESIGYYCGGCVNKCVTHAEFRSLNSRGCQNYINQVCFNREQNCAGEGVKPQRNIQCCQGLGKCRNGTCSKSCLTTSSRGRCVVNGKNGFRCGGCVNKCVTYEEFSNAQANGCQEYINIKCVGTGNCVGEGGTLSSGSKCCYGLKRCSYRGNSQVYCRTRC